METLAWYAAGIRISGRTAVEVTRDPQARFLACAVAATLREQGCTVGTVVDPFVGSGNVLCHVVRATKARRGIGIDANRIVIELARRNFARLERLRKLTGTEIDLYEGDWSLSVGISYTDATLVLLLPPWGDAYGDEGLDLRRTDPPILELLAEISAASGNGPLFALVQTVPQVVVESVQEVLKRYPAFEAKRPEDPDIAAVSTTYSCSSVSSCSCRTRAKCRRPATRRLTKVPQTRTIALRTKKSIVPPAYSGLTPSVTSIGVEDRDDRCGRSVDFLCDQHLGLGDQPSRRGLIQAHESATRLAHSRVARDRSRRPL